MGPKFLVPCPSVVTNNDDDDDVHLYVFGISEGLRLPRVLVYFTCSLYNVQYLFLWEPEVGKSIQFRNLYKIGSTNQDACRAQAGA